MVFSNYSYFMVHTFGYWISATKQTCGDNINDNSDAWFSIIILILWSIPLDIGGQPRNTHG
jgi:hypothetical protein